MPQLQALGFTPADITYMAMSHYHLDHTANANLFAGSTWIVQQAEYDAMFGAKEFAIRDASSYDKLKDVEAHHARTTRTTTCSATARVIIKTAPGHTPGHQMLFLRLKKFGPLLLEGDLYHLPEERTLDRVPTFDFDAAMTRATRVKTEAFLKETGAQMWIQHDPPTNAKLRKAPGVLRLTANGDIPIFCNNRRCCGHHREACYRNGFPLRMWRTVLIYGAVLAAGAFGLQWLQFRLLVRTHPWRSTSRSSRWPSWRSAPGWR